MNERSNVNQFFEKMSGAVKKRPPIVSMQSNPPLTVDTTADDDCYFRRSVLVATEINDFGVGLPPLAYC